MTEKPPPAYPGMRIGLMGGSFNPPHEGHRRVALEALKRLRLDAVWWLVTPGNPLKSHDELAALPQRLAAARAIASHPRIRPTGFEAGLPTPYAVDTAAHLRRRFPGVRFVWIMGADNFLELHRWRDWRRLARLLPLAVFDRPGARFAPLRARAAKLLRVRRLPQRAAAALPSLRPPAWVFVFMTRSPQSSTAIRRAGRAGLPS